MKNMKISTSELAKICGVSQGTVDRALNNRTGISEETKDKIIKAAKEYGYRGKPEKNNRQIGIIVFNLNNEYFSKLITDIEYALRKIGYSAVVKFTHYNKQYEIESIRYLYNMGVDGIIICPVNSGESFENYIQAFGNFPMAAIGNRQTSLPFTGIDDFAAMAELTEEILKDEYENIIYFSPALAYSDADAQKKRFEGFLSKIKLPYSLITDIDKIHETYEEKTVIICSTDYYAMQVYFKTKNVKITGFDNIDAIDKYNLPITSVGYKTEEVAKNALDIIFSNKKESIIIEHSIVKR